MKFKIILCGDHHVGKTSFIKRLIHKQFILKYIPSSLISTHHLSFEDIDLVFCDIPIDSSLLYIQLINANFVLLFFDLTSKDSFDNLNFWLKEIKNINPKVPILILANKLDSFDKELESTDLILNKNEKFKIIQISCKRNINLDLVLQFILDSIKN